MSRKKDTDRVKENLSPYPDGAEVEPPYPIPEYERYEIIEGVRYELQPAPIIAHQKISGSFHLSLHETCHSTGTILYAPIDVYLDEENLFQPDIVYITHEREGIILEKRIEGAPDLVLEILSPSTSQNDKIRKKRQYERFGVREYWIIDPVHQTVDQFLLQDAKFVLHETYGIHSTLTSPLFACIAVDLSRVFPKIISD